MQSRLARWAPRMALTVGLAARGVKQGYRAVHGGLPARHGRVTSPRMKFTLLTHHKEFGKRSNTGQLVAQVLGAQAVQLRWERLQPNAQLLAEIEQGGVALAYPCSGAAAPADLAHITQCVVIDGTWLTARKIHQRSPYLHGLPRVALQPVAASVYHLRQHQIAGGLCTAECVVALLEQFGQHDDAGRLRKAFMAFIGLLEPEA